MRVYYHNRGGAILTEKYFSVIGFVISVFEDTNKISQELGELVSKLRFSKDKVGQTP